MATQTLINPFSMRCGTAVPAELYVSRPVEEATITERVLGSYFNNLSIVGLPKPESQQLYLIALSKKRNN